MSTAKSVPVFSITDRGTSEGSENVAVPAVFSAPLRPDLVQTTFDKMATHTRQAYAVHPHAGKSHSALSLGPGRAKARVPRVKGSGTRRSGQGAYANSCRDGHMFAPTETMRKWKKFASQSTRRTATASAIAGSAVPGIVGSYSSDFGDITHLPYVVSDKIEEVAKTRDLVTALDVLNLAGASGKVKRRNMARKGANYKKHKRGMLLVVSGNASSVFEAARNLKGIDCVSVDRLSLLDVAPGGRMGRLIVWTKSAFEQLGEIYQAGAKSNWQVPCGIVAGSDPMSILYNPGVVRACTERKLHLFSKINVHKKTADKFRLDVSSIDLQA